MKDEQNKSAPHSTTDENAKRKARKWGERSTTLFCMIANWLREMGLTGFLWFLVVTLLHLLCVSFIFKVRSQ